MMGIMPQDKKIASLILGDSGAKAPEVQEDSSAGLDAAMEKMMKAFEAKDKAMLLSAFKEAFTMLYDEQEMLEFESEG